MKKLGQVTKNSLGHAATDDAATAVRSPTAAVVAEHTPGPWGMFWNEENARLRFGSWRFTYNGNHALPLLRCSEGNARARANARLIAAAPDMLAALIEANHLYTNYGIVAHNIDAGDPFAVGAWINNVRDIIAKVRGRS